MSETGQGNGNRRGRLHVRLREARHVLAAAALLAAALAFWGHPAAAAAGLLLAVAAALLPRRPAAERQAEERRREAGEGGAERAMQAILDSLDVPAMLLSRDSLVIHQNAGSVERFGTIVPGAHLSSRIRSPDILEMVQETVLTGRPNVVEHAERIPSERWYTVRIAPVEGMTRQGAGERLFLLTFLDITEARRMDRMRSDFVANASHELRTPLASLMGFIETLQGPAREDRKAQERFLAIMLEQAGRMTRLVDDLMSLSRLELKAHVPPSGAVDLVPLVGHVRDTLRPLADDLGVTIRLEAPSEPVVVAADRDELIQVFENLIENACKYGQSGRFVDVSIVPMRSPGQPERGEGAGGSPVAGPPGGSGSGPGPGGGGGGGRERAPRTDTVEVTVRDYGPGIGPEHVPRLTERFYRVDVDSSRAKKGTGLGLAIVKHILTRHRARLVIRSELGEGSVFAVRLPLAPAVPN